MLLPTILVKDAKLSQRSPTDLRSQMTERGHLPMPPRKEVWGGRCLAFLASNLRDGLGQQDGAGRTVSHGWVTHSVSPPRLQVDFLRGGAGLNSHPSDPSPWQDRGAHQIWAEFCFPGPPLIPQAVLCSFRAGASSGQAPGPSPPPQGGALLGGSSGEPQEA